MRRRIRTIQLLEQPEEAGKKGIEQEDQLEKRPKHYGVGY